jgi:protease II
MESLEDENKQLHLEVIDLKQLVSEMKKKKISIYKTQVWTPPCSKQNLEYKNLQEEMRSQQALLKRRRKCNKKHLILGLMWSGKGNNLPRSPWLKGWYKQN